MSTAQLGTRLNYAVMLPPSEASELGQNETQPCYCQKKGNMSSNMDEIEIGVGIIGVHFMCSGIMVVLWQMASATIVVRSQWEFCEQILTDLRHTLTVCLSSCDLPKCYTAEHKLCYFHLIQCKTLNQPFSLSRISGNKSGSTKQDALITVSCCNQLQSECVLHNDILFFFLIMFVNKSHQTQRTVSVN